jgi:ribosomal protein S12 methylthiotransferase accessory factor
MSIDDVEIDSQYALEQTMFLFKKKNVILSSFGRVFQYSDDPKFFQYFAQTKSHLSVSTGKETISSGFSFFSQENAILKCLSEALERFSLENIYKPIVYSTAKKLDKPNIDISRFASFSPQQRDELGLKLDLNGKYGWVLGKEISTMEDVYIPAQLVYLSYLRNKNESLIRLPISTGAASGTAYSAALYRGICEVIERDAFMITYLNKLSCPRISFAKTKSPLIKKIVRISKNYNLKLLSYDISSDLGVYTFLTIVHDPTDIGPCISVGMKSSLNPEEALLGSIQESFHPRTGLRKQKNAFKGSKKSLLTPQTFKDRGLLWSFKENFKYLDFLINSKKKTKNIFEYKDLSKKNSKDNLSTVISLLKKRGYSSYFVDITPNLQNVKKTSFRVVMAVVPELHPLYINEKYPYFGGGRLKTKNVLNKFPHPFL